ncbi:MAG: CHASE2 domain-containing protein [Elusimicrobia bacterium]|nr:CHASE2 domain-containing protein [Elusimicrobiota bacterium]
MAIGLVLSLFVAACYLFPPVLPLIEPLELKSFDLRSSLRQTGEPSNEIVLVSIDDSALAQVGRWPWPRWRIAALIDKLSGAGSKVIGLNILLSEEELNEGLKEVQQLQTQYQALVSSRNIVEKGVSFSAEFSSAAARLDTDSRLLTSIQGAGSVVLPMFFELGGLAKPAPLPAAISSSVVTYAVVQGAPESEIPDGSGATYPLVRLAEASVGVGHVNVALDLDGSVRREIPIVKYGDGYFPSYALRLIMAYMGMPTTDSVFTPGVKLVAGKLEVPLDSGNGMLVSFVGPVGTFRSYSYREVMKEDFPTETFKGKIVIVGLTAQGVGNLYVTPASPVLSSIELTANVIENVLNRRFLTRPPWAGQAELGLLAFVGLFLMFVYSRLKALWGNLLALVLLIAIPAAGLFLFLQGFWLKVTYPVVLLFAGCLVTLARRLIGTEKGKELVEASAIEQARMLGLSFQGQGMLDMAFDKFRACPVDDNLKDALYNLALDFERKRQYAKAVSVMEHVAAKDPGYKDIAEKMKMLKAASDGAVFGGVGQSKKEGTVLITGGSTKPTLGRYEIEKELGRGAMGIVYLGRDPKINRMVAIKTMMMEEGTDAAAVKEIKERFFREAESAGTLNHPNIIRIFDAGEESDVCYIAMELLDGADLVQFAAKGKLLAPVQAMEYVALVADALDYAHAQGIVHRDIKPANVMLLKDGSIRVADFGIARITASSKTATGTVMGTPSYMSPEQVQGKKVDGRSDLFSLTVALYEFLTGEKPFKGGEGIGTLLFQIANDPHPNILTIRPDLPPGIGPIIDKGLAKDPAKRYARGSLLAADLRALIESIKSGKPMAAPPAPAMVPPMTVPEAPATVAVEVPPPAPAVEAAPPAPAEIKPSTPIHVAPAIDLPAAEPEAAEPPAPAPKIELEPRGPAQEAPEDGGIPMAPSRGGRGGGAPAFSLPAPGVAGAGVPPPLDMGSGLPEPPVAEPPAPEAQPEPVVEPAQSEPAVEPAGQAEPAVEPAAEPSYAEDKTIVMSAGSIPVLSPDLVMASSPEPSSESTDEIPSFQLPARSEPAAESVEPEPAAEGIKLEAMGEGVEPEPPAQGLKLEDVSEVVEPEPIVQGLQLEPAVQPEPSYASDKTVVLSPGSVPVLSPALVMAPSPEPSPEDTEPSYASDKTVVLSPGSIPVLSPDLVMAPSPEPSPEDTVPAFQLPAQSEPAAESVEPEPSYASDKTVVLTPGSVPLMSPPVSAEPAPDAPPAAEDSSEFKIALEHRATLKSSFPPGTAFPGPAALAGDVPPPPSSGEQPSSDDEFKIVLEKRATVRPSAAPGSKLPLPRALDGDVPPLPSAGEQPSADGEFKIMLEPRATMKSEAAVPPPPPPTLPPSPPPGWKPGGGGPAA